MAERNVEMNIKKLFLISVCFTFAVCASYADTLVDNTTASGNIASTSYVKGGLATRLVATEVSSTGSGNIVTDVTIDTTNSLNKKVKKTLGEVQVPIKENNVTSSYTPIWVE